MSLITNGIEVQRCKIKYSTHVLLELVRIDDIIIYNKKKVREKSRECHNHKPQPFPDPKRKRKPSNLNKHKPNKRTKSTKISSLFPKRGNRNTKRTEKHKNKMTHGKTYNKSPCRINYKATKSKTNTRTTALEWSIEQTTRGFKALLQLANFTLVFMYMNDHRIFQLRINRLSSGWIIQTG